MGINKRDFKEYFTPEFLIRTIKLLKFLLIYTIVFFILLAGLKFAIPFVIAILIAMTLKPIKHRILRLNNRFKRLKLSNGFVSFILTMTIVLICLAVLSVIGYQIFIQMTRFLQYITNESTVKEILYTTDKIVNSVLVKMNNLDPKLVVKINESIMQLVTVISSMATILGRNLLSLAISIPSGIVVTFITLIATYFFTKDIDSIQSNVNGVFSNKGHNLISNIRLKLNSVFGGYIKAYALIMLAVGVISFIIFEIAQVEYALPLAILTALLDVLPLIGAGIIYLILISSNYFLGKTTIAIILVIGFVIVVLVRQLLEQNLVASFIGVHPLVMIIGLFIAFTPLGFAGMFYFIGAFLLYQAVK